MRHKRIIGTTDATATKLGGENWDDNHAYGAGELVLVGILKWGHTVGDSFVRGISLSGLAPDPTLTFAVANILSGHIDLSAVPVMATLTANMRGVLVDTGAVPSPGNRLSIWTNSAGDIEVQWLNASDAIIAAPVNSAPTVMIYALVG